MTRVFRRGELTAAVLDALDQTGPSNGYGIMQALAARIGGGWQPSPGAIYPALLGLEDAGLVTCRNGDGSRLYELTEAGTRARARNEDVLDAVAARAAREGVPRPRVGRVLDDFAAGFPRRSVHLDANQQGAVAQVLERAATDIDRLLDEPSTDEGEKHG